MAALNLFPARVAFVNPDGTLTNEAYRALQMIFERVGGALGDSGADVFGQVFGRTGDVDSTLQNDVVQSFNAPDIVYSNTMQPANFGTNFYSDVVQYQASSKDIAGSMFPDVVQQPSKDREPGIFTTLDVSGDASIGGKLKLSAGTVALPSLYWSTDTTTGFYRIGANNTGYAVSGVKVLDVGAANFGVFGLFDLSAATSGQIKFPSSQNASTDTNTFDDYKEGSWTPNQGGAITLVGTFSSSGTYTKVGNLVTVIGQMNGSTSIAASSGGILTSNLPFSTSGSAAVATGGITNGNVNATSLVVASVSILYVTTSIAATPNLYFSITYRTS